MPRARSAQRPAFWREIFDAALSFIPVLAICLRIWLTAEPPPSGETLRLLIKSAELSHTLAERSGYLDERCQTAHRIAELYKLGQNASMVHRWEDIAEPPCARLDEIERANR